MSPKRSNSSSPTPPPKRQRQTNTPLKPVNIYTSCPLAPKGDSIRLLTLREGPPKAPIECTLTTRLLAKSAPPKERLARYEALSYHWGTDTADKAIQIFTAGKIYPDTFMIRPNLYSALKQLRLRDSERDLWIDVICINQDNDDEKNSQVSLMDDVYSEATSVCVWLGEAADDSDLALSFIQRVVNLDDFDRLVADGRTPHEWVALSALMKRKWFSRRWVVQEIALAARATLYCGGAEVDWFDFADAVSLFEAVETESHIINKNIMKAEFSNHIPDFLGEIKFLGATRLVDATSNLFRKSISGKVLDRLLTLEALISTLSAFEATRPHDIIYAVLNLAKGIHSSAKQPDKVVDPGAQESNATGPSAKTAREQELIKLTTKRFGGAVQGKRFVIDYKRDFFDVCKDFLTFTIQNEASLDIICRPWVPEDGIVPEQNRPSWLLTTERTAYGLRPDGNYSRANADTLVGAPGLGKRNYNASGALKVTKAWKFGEGTKSRSMYAEGFVIDRVKKKKPYAADGIILHEWLAAGGWSDVSALPPDPFWRTLVADRGPNGSNPPTYYPRACKSALKQSVKNGHISTTTLVHNGKSTIVAKFLRRVQEVVWMRRLMITKGDKDGEMLGLGPEKMKKGDLICILYGCSVPVLLRPQQDESTMEEYFEFIGECYVHGIMDGEAFDLARKRSDDETITKKVFELR